MVNTDVTDNTYANILVAADQFCDLIPIVHTFSNLINLFQKCAVIPFLDNETVENSRYFTYLQNKSALHCVVLAVPVNDFSLVFRTVIVTKWYIHNGIENCLIALDEFSDSIPFVSSATNITNLFLKFAVIPAFHAMDIGQNRFFEYIERKDTYRCIALLFPVVGNIVVLMHDLSNKFEETLIKWDENYYSTPFVSTFAAIIDALLKNVIIPFIEPEVVENNLFLRHKQQKEALEILIGLVPFYKESVDPMRLLFIDLILMLGLESSAMQKPDDPLKFRDIIVQQDWTMLFHGDEPFQKNFSRVLSAVKENGLALASAHEQLQANKTIVLAAVRENWRALIYAQGGLNDDVDVLREAIKQNPKAAEFAGPRFQNLWRQVLNDGIDSNKFEDLRHNDPEMMELLQFALNEKNRFTHSGVYFPGSRMSLDEIDCLKSFFELKDLFVLKLVSRAWREVAEDVIRRHSSLNLRTTMTALNDRNKIISAAHLADFRSLRTLDLEGCNHLHPNILKMMFQSFPNLDAIDLNRSIVVGDANATINYENKELFLSIISEYLNDFRTLRLRNCQFPDECLQRIIRQNNRTLEILDISFNILRIDQSLSEVAQCPNLLALTLCLVAISEDCFSTIVQRCTRLQILNISYLINPNLPGIILQRWNLGNGFFQAIAQHCQHLILLDLSCNHIDEQALIPIFSHLIHLQTLNMRETGIGSDTLRAIAQHCPQLRSIDLSGDYYARDALAELVRDCTHLESLNIANFNISQRNNYPPFIRDEARCTTDETIRVIAPLCEHLRYLDLRENYFISDASLREFVEHFPKLQELDMSRCPHLTETAVIELRQARPGLQIRFDQPNP